ncbi:MAG TPA: transcriptional regulator [Kiritimatiellia bacterium]|nr:transcriptional regulator [Kiritimatiellia bacterium]
MKLVMAVYNIGVDEEVMAAMEQEGVVCFTKIPRVVGKGKATGPRLDNSVWPGANTLSLFVVPDERAQDVMRVFEKLRATIGRKAGLKAFLLHVEQQTA